MESEIRVRIADELLMFLPAARREPVSRVAWDGTSTLGHVVESLGVPLTEVGGLTVDGRASDVSHVPAARERIHVSPIVRPQALPGPPRFLLDVHLGTLARRLRLLGVDAAYERLDIGDAALAAQSAREQRVMLSRDRGLLHRRELWAGAYVYSHRPEEQLTDVLERFAPPLAPWTRCAHCGASLHPVPLEAVATRLQAGTRRSYREFAQCRRCGRVYWRGAHSRRLEPLVEQAEQVVRRRLGRAGPSS